MNRPLRAAFISCLLLVFSACEPAETPDPNAAKRAEIEGMYAGYRDDFPGILEISADELAARRAQEDVVIVDVREPEERAVSTIPGAVAGDAFEHDLDTYRDKTIVVYCTIGYRSGRYVAKLKERGIDAYNLEGSILSWVHAGQPVVAPNGSETKRVHVYGSKWDLLPDGYEAVW